LSRLIIYPRRKLKLTLGAPLSIFRALSALLSHLWALRQERYDVVLDFQGNLKSGLHLLLARGCRKIGFAAGHGKEGNFLFARETVAPRAEARHRIEKSMELASVLGCSKVPPPHLILSDAEVTEARALLEEFRGARLLVIMHPGTSAFGAFKRWAPHKFAAVAGALVTEVGARVLVTWGPGEETLADSLVFKVPADLRAHVHRSPSLRSLLLLAAVIREADLFIGCDSAPLVLASLVDTPAIGLFGPKDPALYGPFSPLSDVVRSKVPCSPCTRRQCPDVICMEEISEETVISRALLKLKVSRVGSTR
jgi:ADP-heptose:LPS heptosyltransferase